MLVGSNNVFNGFKGVYVLQMSVGGIVFLMTGTHLDNSNYLLSEGDYMENYVCILAVCGSRVIVNKSICVHFLSEIIESHDTLKLWIY